MSETPETNSSAENNNNGNGNSNNNNNNNSSNSSSNNNNNNVKVAIVAAAAVCIVAICATAVILLGGKDEEPDSGIGYAQGATVVLDENALQAAVDEAQRNAEEGNIALNYQNDAFSMDGKNFTCYIVNDAANKFDMFLTICTDSSMTEQVLLTGLVPPGSGFQKLTLDRELGKGDHTVYVAVTMVDTEEDGTQVMKSQVVHTMVFHVS